MNFPHYKVWRQAPTASNKDQPRPVCICICAARKTAKLIAAILDRLFADKVFYTFESAAGSSVGDPCLKMYVSPDNCTILSRYGWVRYIAVNEYKQGAKTCSPEAWEMANNRFDQYVREGILKPWEK